jgi:hypothetical protein
MLDAETLGTRPGFVVLSAAFVRFSDMASNTLVLDAQEQTTRLGLEVDPATYEWWGQQNPAAWAAATTNPLPVKPALEHFAAWLAWARNAGELRLWCHGAAFDAPLLGELYRRLASLRRGHSATYATHARSTTWPAWTRRTFPTIRHTTRLTTR